MPVIAVVHRAGARAALRQGVPRRAARIVSCRDLPHVQRLLARELVDAIVVDILALGSPEPAFALTAAFPRIPVFAFSAFRPDDSRLLAACYAGGLRGVLVDGVDTPVAGHIVACRTASRERQVALGDAPRRLRLTEPLQRRAWDEVFLRAGAPTTTADIARALRRTREHLSREFAAGGAPNLKRVIDLARAVCAADLLANPGYDVGGVARILGYSSPGHLAGVSRRIAGVRPSELGRLGPPGVFQRFLKGRTRSRI
jgi:AraC-like DNA-binding protein